MTPATPSTPLRPEPGPNLGAFLAMISRQARLILTSAGLVFGLALLALVLVRPSFTATVLVMVDPARKNLLSPEPQVPTQSASENARVESEVGILRSDRVALSTVKAADLLTDSEFGPAPGTLERLSALLGMAPVAAPGGADLLEATLKRLRQAISVRRDGLTYLVRVSVTARDPQKAARLANTLSRTYIDLQLQAKVDSFLSARDLLRGQIDAAQARLARSEDALDLFREAHLDPAGNKGGTGDQIRDLQLVLRDIDAARLRAQSLATLADGAIAARDWDTFASGLADEAMSVLLAQRRDLRQQMKGAPDTAPQIDLRDRIARIEQGLSLRAETVAANLRKDLGRVETRARGVRGQLRQQEIGGELSSDALSRIYALRQDSDIAQRHYGTLLSRLRELEAQAVLQVADSRIVSDALPPADPSFPRVGILLALALVAATGLGVGAGMARDYATGGITSIAQLQAMLPGTMVIAIPRTPSPDPSQGRGSGHSPPTPLADLVLDAPLSGFSESLRRLRAAVERGAPGLMEKPGAKAVSRAVVIMVGSTLSDEGKTTVALALARTCRAAGRRTLLIDADMRRPGVQAMLGLPPSRGLSEHLECAIAGSSQISAPARPPVPGSALIDDPRSGIQVLPAGRGDLRATDRALQSARFADLIERARGLADVIIIDTPPLEPVVDALHVARHADVLVHCVRFASTSQATVAGVLDQIADVAPNVNVVAVLTHASPQVAPAGSGYHTDAPLPPLAQPSARSHPPAVWHSHRSAVAAGASIGTGSDPRGAP